MEAEALVEGDIGQSQRTTVSMVKKTCSTTCEQQK